MNEAIDGLRADVLGLPFSYQQIADEAGFDKHGASYVRKFAAGEIADLTTTKFFALKGAVSRLKRKRHAAA